MNTKEKPRIDNPLFDSTSLEDLPDKQAVTPVPKCTASVVPLVRIQISGEDNPKGRYYSKKDGGLIANFLKWTIDAGVFSAMNCGGHSGAGEYMGFFTPENAEKVKDWLKTQGIEEFTEEIQ